MVSPARPFVYPLSFLEHGLWEKWLGGDALC